MTIRANELLSAVLYVEVIARHCFDDCGRYRASTGVKNNLEKVLTVVGSFISIVDKLGDQESEVEVQRLNKHFKRRLLWELI